MKSALRRLMLEDEAPTAQLQLLVGTTGRWVLAATTLQELQGEFQARLVVLRLHPGQRHLLVLVLKLEGCRTGPLLLV